MFRMFLVAVVVIALSGCAFTKWECTSSVGCLPKEQAVNKCLAQANAAASRSKMRIWEQCMRGEGFSELPCKPNKADKECKPFHVF